MDVWGAGRNWKDCCGNLVALDAKQISGESEHYGTYELLYVNCQMMSQDFTSATGLGSNEYIPFPRRSEVQAQDF